MDKIGISDRVFFMGYVSDELLPHYYNACDLYVMPSEYLGSTGSIEGFGLSFLEANAAGLTSIGTRTGGIPTAIKHEETGLLCEANTNSFKKALDRLKKDEVFRKKLEINALNWSLKNDWLNVVNKIDMMFGN